LSALLVVFFEPRLGFGSEFREHAAALVEEDHEGSESERGGHGQEADDPRGKGTAFGEGLFSQAAVGQGRGEEEGEKGIAEEGDGEGGCWGWW
jgi:hypothetical protein